MNITQRVAAIAAAAIVPAALTLTMSSGANAGPAELNGLTSGPTIIMPDPETADVEQAPKRAPKKATTHFQRYCDDGATYQTFKKTQDGPAFIKGTREKFINVTKGYDGPEPLHVCNFVVIGDPTLSGLVYSIRLPR